MISPPFPHDWRQRARGPHRCAVCGAKRIPEREGEECQDLLRAEVDRLVLAQRAWRQAVSPTEDTDHA